MRARCLHGGPEGAGEIGHSGRLATRRPAVERYVKRSADPSAERFVERGVASGVAVGFPVHAKWQGLATAGLVISAVTLPWRRRSRWLALSLGTQATTAVLIALALIAHRQHAQPTASGGAAPAAAGLDVMLLTNLAATSILLIAASYAAGYIFLDAGLKRRASWGRLRQWPPLTVLSRRFTHQATLGSVLLTIGLILGIVQRSRHHDPLMTDVHTWVVAMTLGLFLAVVASSKLRRVSLRTRAAITVCGGGLLFIGIAVGALNLHGSTR